MASGDGQDRGWLPGSADPGDPGNRPGSTTAWPGKRTITEGIRSPGLAAPSAPADPEVTVPEPRVATPPEVLAAIRAQIKADLT